MTSWSDPLYSGFKHFWLNSYRLKCDLWSKIFKNPKWTQKRRVWLNNFPNVKCTVGRRCILSSEILGWRIFKINYRRTRNWHKLAIKEPNKSQLGHDRTKTEYCDHFIRWSFVSKPHFQLVLRAKKIFSKNDTEEGFEKSMMRILCLSVISSTKWKIPWIIPWFSSSYTKCQNSSRYHFVYRFSS